MDEDIEGNSHSISTKSKNGKIKYYHQRFRESWRDNKKLRGWIEPPRTIGSTGHCKICKVDLKGSRTLLERHHLTNKHKKNSISQGIPVPEIDYGVEDESQSTGSYGIGEESLIHMDEDDVHMEMVDNDDPLNYIKMEPKMSRQSIKKEMNNSYSIEASSPKAGSIYFQIPQMLFNNDDAKQNLDDHLTSFGLYVGNELRRIQSKYAKQLAKCKINNVIFEVTTGLYNQPTDNNLTKNTV